MEKEFGTIVISLAGHDKDAYYVLFDSDSNFVYLVDGKTRTLEKPKKKNRKHIRFTNTKIIYKDDKYGIDKLFTNEFIKKKVKEYEISIKRD